nr:SpoIIE family protein phosphatase [Candidatus Cloacimonadota bacterium]
MALAKKGKVHLVEYDNPPAFFFRNDELLNIPYRIRKIGNKTIREAELEIRDGDVIVFVSDGEIHAGLNGTCNLDWDWDSVADFIDRISGKDMTSAEIAFELINVASKLYGLVPGDDTSAVVVRVRYRRKAAVIIGAPQDKAQDCGMVNDFMQTPGHKIICGGTTSNIVSRELGKPMSVDISTMVNNIPPIGIIAGIDLCTEGIITLSNALKNIIEKTSYKKLELEHSGASLLTKELFQADDITFFIGQAVNEANQENNLPFEMGHKNQIIGHLIEELKKAGKQVAVKLY